jgi:vacuolar iron transporter family protein
MRSERGLCDVWFASQPSQPAVAAWEVPSRLQVALPYFSASCPDDPNMSAPPFQSPVPPAEGDAMIVEAKLAPAPHVENHGGLGSDRVKSIVFGGLDGVITTFSIVAAVAGAQLPIQTALLMGFSNLIADGISMGLGDFLSSKAESEYQTAESKREKWEFESARELELLEQENLFTEKGMSKEDATLITHTLAKYPEIFHEVHLPSELGFSAPDKDASPAKDGIATFTSFLVFGSVPMWSYVITYYAGYRTASGVFGIACVFTALTLFLLGVTQASITRQPRLKAGLLMTLNGGLAASAA